ncbi:MAG TPA: ferritin-like domain-containing protein, partial [Nannocystis sp.]
MRLTLDPFRTSLLAALGLIACGPIDKTSGDEGGSDSSGAASTSGAGDTTAVTSATDPTTGATETTQGSATSGQTGGQTDTGKTTDGSTSSATTDTTGDDTGAVSCPSEPVPALQGFTDPPVPSGFERCEMGILHRAEKLACDVPQTPSTCLDNMLGGCTSDADCVEKPFGSCQQDMVFGGFTEGSCSCVYGCQTDDDCAAGEICRCAGDGLGLYTQCIAADCTVDSDCPDGEICGLSPDACAPGGFLTACTTPADTCDDNSECPQPGCMFELDHWVCSNIACGRPFVVEAQAVVAPLQARDDWRALLATPEIDAALAPRLAEYWANIGQLEHASVAAFAQFVLQLLAVGAPPTLVLAAQRALADEVEHARLCFGLASLYKKNAGVGPGPLAISGAVAPADLATLVDAVIREACIGETLAAFEAREAAAQAEDPVVRAVLGKIAADEARHAELGWQFVQWALVDDAAVARARATFESAIAEARRGVERDAQAVGAPELRAHGVVDAPLRAEVWAEGLRAVVEPCAAA